MARGLAVLILIAARVASADVPPSTGPFTTTGELVPAGALEKSMSGTFLYAELAYGLGDQLELRYGSPLLPLPILGGDVQLRASLLPRTSRVGLVLGAEIAAGWWADPQVWLGASATAIVRGDRVGFHATVRVADRSFDDHAHVALGTAGVTWRAGTTATLFADVGQLSYVHGATCAGYHGAEVACVADDVVDGAVLGLAWRRDGDRFSISAMVVRYGDFVMPIGPLLAYTF